MTPAEQKILKRRSQLLEMKNKGYTDEFIKFAFFANDPTANIDSDLAQYNDLTGQGSQPVTVGGRQVTVGDTITPKDYADIQAKETQQAQMKVSAREDLQKKLATLQEISQDEEGIGAAVGPNPLARPITPFSGAKQRVANKLESILSTDTLDALINAKAEGATFGALSDAELALLRASAGVLAQSAVKDDNGKIVGFNMAEEDFKKELATLTENTQKAFSSINAETAPVGRTQGQPKVQDPAKVQAWLDANPDDPRAEQVRQLLQSQNLDANPAPASSAVNALDEPNKAVEFGKGVGKSVLSTLQGASDIGQGMLGSVTEKIGLGRPERAALPENLTTATNGAQKAGKITGDIAQLIIPGTNGLKVAQVAKSTGLGTKLVAAIAKEAPSAITASGITAAQEGSTENMLRDALLFGTLSKVGSALGKVKDVATKTLPGKIVDTAIKPSLDDARKAILYKGKSIGQELLDRGITGGDRKILNVAIKNINKAEDKLQTILAGSKETISRNEIAKYLTSLAKKKQATPGLSAEVEKIQKVLMDFPETISIKEANVMKRNLYTALSDTAFKLDASMATQKEAMKAIAKGIKSEIEKKTVEFGDDTVKALNQDLSVFGRTRDAIVDKLARGERNNLLGLGDIGAGAVGAVTAGAPGAAAIVAGKMAAGSTLVKTKSAMALKRVGAALDKTGNKLNATTKAAVMKAIQEILDDEN